MFGFIIFRLNFKKLTKNLLPWKFSLVILEAVPGYQ